MEGNDAPESPPAPAPERAKERVRNGWLRRLLLPWKAAPGGRFSPVLLGTPLSRAEIGLLGELLAAKYLRGKGRHILYRNYRAPTRGEVDIVARHRRVLCFVEVKTRTGTSFGRPADAVNPDKRRLIQRGALAWLRLLGNPRIPCRFDIAEVTLTPGEVPRIHVIENAFQMPDFTMAGR